MLVSCEPSAPPLTAPAAAPMAAPSASPKMAPIAPQTTALLTASLPAFCSTCSATCSHFARSDSYWAISTPSGSMIGLLVFDAQPATSRLPNNIALNSRNLHVESGYFLFIRSSRNSWSNRVVLLRVRELSVIIPGARKQHKRDPTRSADRAGMEAGRMTHQRRFRGFWHLRQRPTS